MTAAELICYRLINQQLAGSEFKSPVELVRWMGAMQAQEYHWARWAIGSRLNNVTEKAVELAVDSGEIIRTHVMRPTWHLVTARDVRWMLALSAPTLMNKLKTVHKQLGLAPQLFKRSHAIVEKALEKKGTLTRDELVDELRKNRIKPDNLQMIHIMFNAELQATVCNGPMRGKQFTYALLEERAPKALVLKKDEALAELALRYFTSHGPATLSDYAWWSGLPAADAKHSLDFAKDKLQCEKTGDQVYWFKHITTNGQVKPIYFLAAYDEFMVSYKDRSASLDPRFFNNAITGNGIFKPIIVQGGQVKGVWSREISKTNVTVRAEFFKSAFKIKKADMANALVSYGNFLGQKIKL